MEEVKFEVQTEVSTLMNFSISSNDSLCVSVVNKVICEAAFDNCLNHLLHSSLITLFSDIPCDEFSILTPENDIVVDFDDFDLVW